MRCECCGADSAADSEALEEAWDQKAELNAEIERLKDTIAGLIRLATEKDQEIRLLKAELEVRKAMR